MGELVSGGESPAMANADQQGMQAPEKYQGWKPAKKESRGFIRRVGQALPDGVASFDTHEIAPPHQEDADAQKEASSHLAFEPTAHENAETSGYPAQ